MLRHDAGFSPRDLERRSGLRRSTLSRIERGLRRPRAYTLGWIAWALNPDTVQVVKRKLCTAAGTSLMAESRWSERSHARHAWDALLSGELPLPAWLAALYVLEMLGAVLPDRLDELRQADQRSRQGLIPWPEGAQGSTEALLLGGELVRARPYELARIGRMFVAASNAEASRIRRRRIREQRARLGMTGTRQTLRGTGGAR